MTGKRLVSFVTILSLLALNAACMHSVRITTDPDGADVTINGQYQGATPIVFRDRSGIPKTYYVKIEKRGYKTVESVIEQQYKFGISLLWFVLGIIPGFFTATLEDQYEFKLQP